MRILVEVAKGYTPGDTIGVLSEGEIISTSVTSLIPGGKAAIVIQSADKKQIGKLTSASSNANAIDISTIMTVDRADVASYGDWWVEVSCKNSKKKFHSSMFLQDEQESFV